MHKSSAPSSPTSSRIKVSASTTPTPKSAPALSLANLELMGLPDSTLPLLSPPSFPSFPTIADLCSGIPATRRADPGLFEALLAGPLPLYEDATKHPEKYEAELLELLSQLIIGQRSLKALTAEETALLDRATLEFAQAPRPERKAATPNAMAPAKKSRQKRMNESRKTSKRERRKAESESDLAPFWWRGVS